MFLRLNIAIKDARLVAAALPSWTKTFGRGSNHAAPTSLQCTSYVSLGQTSSASELVARTPAAMTLQVEAGWRRRSQTMMAMGQSWRWCRRGRGPGPWILRVFICPSLRVPES